MPPLTMRAHVSTKSLDLKESILATFTADGVEARNRLAGFDEADWRSVMPWLDISGMALYLLHRIRMLGIESALPSFAVSELNSRFLNNRRRSSALFAETCALASWFQDVDLCYALLKGFSLVPDSVPSPALRAQTDLDFLVCNRHAELATHYIHRLGYSLHAAGGSTLEFRAGTPPVPDLANLYLAHAQRALELHIAREGTPEARLLTRRVRRRWNQHSFHALSAADVLVQQARHVLKHLCGEHTRISWLLEFQRHLNTRMQDATCMRLAALHAEESPDGNLAMAVALCASAQVFGPQPYALPAQWRSESLPAGVRLWLERYARELLLSDAVGSKLYALLRAQMPEAASTPRTLAQILLPRVWPAPVMRATPGERLAEKARRYAVEARFVVWRLWFHVREGVRFAIEQARWNRLVARVSR